MDRWITQAEYARKYHVSPSAVCQAVKAGRLKRRKDGKVDSSTPMGGNVPDPEIQKLRVEKMKIEMELKRTQLEEIQQQIADKSVDEFCHDINYLITSLQTEIRNLYVPKEIADRLDSAYHKFLEQLKAEKEAKQEKIKQGGKIL